MKFSKKIKLSNLVIGKEYIIIPRRRSIWKFKAKIKVEHLHDSTSVFGTIIENNSSWITNSHYYFFSNDFYFLEV